MTPRFLPVQAQGKAELTTVSRGPGEFFKITVCQVVCNQVKAQIGNATEFSGHTKVQANGLGMTNMQMAIGLRRKTRDDFLVLSGFEVTFNNISYKVTDSWSLIVIHYLGLLNNSIIGSVGDSEF